MHKPVCILFYCQLSGITGVEVAVIPVVLSGTILKWLVAIIMTFEIVMQKSALKICMIPQKSE